MECPLCFWKWPMKRELTRDQPEPIFCSTRTHTAMKGVARLQCTHRILLMASTDWHGCETILSLIYTWTCKELRALLGWWSVGMSPLQPLESGLQLIPPACLSVNTERLLLNSPNFPNWTRLRGSLHSLHLTLSTVCSGPPFTIFTTSCVATLLFSCQKLVQHTYSWIGSNKNLLIVSYTWTHASEGVCLDIPWMYVSTVL